MNFEKLPTIEQAAFYVDLAFRRGSEAVTAAKDVKLTKRVNKVEWLKRSEHARIHFVTKTLIDNFERIKGSYPHLESLAPFYRELALTMIDIDQYRSSMYRIGRVKAVLIGLKRKYVEKLHGARDIAIVHGFRQEFLGRAASVVKDIAPALKFLAEARRTMRNFPDVRTDVPTVVIAGFPNVGKSTLLKALTGSAPEIAPYPFTTKQLMVGYRRDNGVVQFIDTPGLLDRPLAKRNPVERQAVLALSHLATLVLYVLDPSESCGYALDLQIKLGKELKQDFPRVLFALGKADLAPQDAIARAKGELPHALVLSAQKERGIKELVAVIEKELKHKTPP